MWFPNGSRTWGIPAASKKGTNNLANGPGPGGESTNQIKGQINPEEPSYRGEIPEPDKRANWSRGGSRTGGTR